MVVYITVTFTTVKLLPGSSSKIRLARISTSPLDPEALRHAIADPAGGAIAMFIGVVRNHDEGREVGALSYSAHPSAQEQLLGILSNYAAKPEVLALAVEHRVGDLQVGDLAMVCGVTSAHRDVAFSVCSALVEEVKAQVPIWKNQTFVDGSNEWIGAS
jgi:molybdopterin synthase catalytic subunit